MDGAEGISALTRYEVARNALAVKPRRPEHQVAVAGQASEHRGHKPT